MEVLIEDEFCWKYPQWLEVSDFMFHTTGEYPIVDVWIPGIGKCRSYSLLCCKGFRIKE